MTKRWLRYMLRSVDSFGGKRNEAHLVVAVHGLVLASCGTPDVLRRHQDGGAWYPGAHAEFDQLPCFSNAHHQHCNAHDLSSWFDQYNSTSGSMRCVPTLDTMHNVQQRFRDYRW